MIKKIIIAILSIIFLFGCFSCQNTAYLSTVDPMPFNGDLQAWCVEVENLFNQTNYEKTGKWYEVKVSQNRYSENGYGVSTEEKNVYEMSVFYGEKEEKVILDMDVERFLMWKDLEITQYDYLTGEVKYNCGEYYAKYDVEHIVPEEDILYMYETIINEKEENLFSIFDLFINFDPTNLYEKLDGKEYKADIYYNKIEIFVSVEEIKDGEDVSSGERNQKIKKDYQVVYAFNLQTAELESLTIIEEIKKERPKNEILEEEIIKEKNEYYCKLKR